MAGIKCRFERDDRNWADCFWDSICGEYSITDDAIKKLDSSHENKRKITNVLAQRRCRGINVPLRITSDNQGKDGDWSLETIQYLLSQYPTSPLEMLDESLVNISYLIKHPSEDISITKDKVWYLYSFDLTSCSYMIRQLEQLGFIKLLFNGVEEQRITIEAKGWNKLSELQKSLSKYRNKYLLQCGLMKQ